MTGQKPAALLYDGQCGICSEWVDYWRQLTGGKVEYLPYQTAAGDYPDLSEKALAKSIHLIEADGVISKGAEATYRLYRGIHPQSVLLFLYRFLPGFGRLSELGYRFFAAHRRLLAFVTHLFWGRNHAPPRYQFISRLFLRLLGLVYLIAFLSFAVQSGALIGADGVLPLRYYLSAVSDQYGAAAYMQLPTIFWVSHADAFISCVCIAGILLALLLLFGLFLRIGLILLYLLYLSLVNAGQVFMSFQWDILLLECGFLAIFLPWGSGIIVWLYRWLLFRFIFLSGVVKMLSHDPGWQNLSALNHHFETQPLPTPLSWYVHHLPEILLKAATGMTLIIELILPFFIFAPRNFRHTAACGFLLFQTVILLTGNYNFFNLLTLFMCLFLFDDAAIKRIVPARIPLRLPRIHIPVPRIHIPTAGKIASGCALFIALISVYIGGTKMLGVIGQDSTVLNTPVHRLLRPFNIVNNYGPFAVMTVARNEIAIEGSADGVTWQEYRFEHKPDDPQQCPGWVAPHQPRIDWQMWFAALSNPDTQRWLWNMLIRLLQDSEPVTAIFADNPFPDEPPDSVRAVVYRYTFTSVEERNETGRCWNRKFLGEYYPAMSIGKIR